MFSCCQFTDKNVRLARKKDLEWSKPVYKLTNTKRSIERSFHLFYEEICGKSFGDVRFLLQDLKATKKDGLFFTRTFLIFDTNQDDTEKHHLFTFPQFSINMWNFLSMDLYMLSEWLFRTNFGGHRCEMQGEASIDQVVSMINVMYGVSAANEEDGHHKKLVKNSTEFDIEHAQKLVKSYAGEFDQLNMEQFAKLVKQAPELLQGIFGIQTVQREHFGGTSYWNHRAVKRASLVASEQIKTSEYDDIVSTIRKSHPKCLCMPTPDIIKEREILLSTGRKGSGPGNKIRGIDMGPKGRIQPGQHNGSKYVHHQEGVGMQRHPSQSHHSQSHHSSGAQHHNVSQHRSQHHNDSQHHGHQQHHQQSHRGKTHDHSDWDIDKKHHHKKVNYGDWVKEQDPTTKMEFYKNTKTGQKQFKEPPIIKNE